MKGGASGRWFAAVVLGGLLGGAAAHVWPPLGIPMAIAVALPILLAGEFSRSQ